MHACVPLLEQHLLRLVPPVDLPSLVFSFLLSRSLYLVRFYDRTEPRPSRKPTQVPVDGYNVAELSDNAARILPEQSANEF